MVFPWSEVSSLVESWNLSMSCRFSSAFLVINIIDKILSWVTYALKLKLQTTTVTRVYGRAIIDWPWSLYFNILLTIPLHYLAQEPALKSHEHQEQLCP
jgi:ABC-type transport system involved in multi-copper enzyme maturation permease subunit